MTATHVVNSTVYPAPVLYLALELGWKTWKLAFTVGLGQKLPGYGRSRPATSSA